MTKAKTNNTAYSEQKGVLTKYELKALIDEQELLKEYNLKNLEPCSYDLRIGTAFQHGRIIKEDDKKSNNTIVIKPSEIVTFLTKEILNIPNGYVGIVFPINRQSSKGLLILNPGQIDPGFIGPITVCAVNLSKEDIRIGFGDEIFTLMIHRLTGDLQKEDLYPDHYNVTKDAVKDRKSKEETFNRNSALKLSDSFFDLITTYKDTPYFREQVIEVVRNQMFRVYTIVSGIAVALITVFTFLVNNGVINLNNPFDDSESRKAIISQYDSLYMARSEEMDHQLIELKNEMNTILKKKEQTDTIKDIKHVEKEH